MKRYNIGAGIVALTLLSGAVVAPITASAQFRADQLDKESKRRQKTKNDWRNIGAGAGAVGLFGLLKGNSLLTIAGLGGAAYSASRYEHDRKSQSKTDRARADLYGRSSFDHNGKHYVRQSYYKDGQKYYRFVKR